MAISGQNTTLLNTITLSEYTDLTRRQFEVLNNRIEPKAKQLFISDFIGQGQGSVKRYQETDGETFADVKPEGANSQKAKVAVGYAKDMTIRTFSKEIDITIEMRVQNRYK